MRRQPAPWPPAGARQSSPIHHQDVWEHASLGIDDEAVVDAEPNRAALVETVLPQRDRATGRPASPSSSSTGANSTCRFWPGARNGPEVLPCRAEIDFCAFPPGQAANRRLRAKWDDDSFEYQHTPRRFDFPAGGSAPCWSASPTWPAACWHLFGLRGYARVDFRVDGDGRPWILEVNANPCLSPDAGFRRRPGPGGDRLRPGGGADPGRRAAQTMPSRRATASPTQRRASTGARFAGN